MPVGRLRICERLVGSRMCCIRRRLRRRGIRNAERRSAIQRRYCIPYVGLRLPGNVVDRPTEEAARRTLDYWNIGWHVIWLLHATTYGRSTASCFEKRLLTIPHYFTDIGYRGGKIWDELSAVRGRKRFWYLLPPRRKEIKHLEIEILQPPSNTIQASGFPLTPEQWVNTRRSSWSCRFHDDLFITGIFESTCTKQPGESISPLKRGRMLLHLLWLRCFG